MADLEKHGDRKDWLRWAIELLRRGIWAGDVITVHGPHGPDSPFMWGEVEGWLDGAPGGGLFTFRTASDICGIYDVRGVRVRDDDGNSFPLLPPSELSPKARRWLLVAERLCAQLTVEAIDLATIGKRLKAKRLHAPRPSRTDRDG